ncbi:hypothetical protein WR25_17669 [Diploscapter pachys]|uniref:Uncharacterized protein n=1 Tax=Diploscapter pachys TaxID=2018661 RepID=A0A2A2KWV0_9BILA|nr:hypothetical protein WR25_17669 [Diploscapter pachys]
MQETRRTNGGNLCSSQVLLVKMAPEVNNRVENQPVIKKFELPEFMQKADKKLVRLFKGVWTDETDTMGEKLDSLDALAANMFSISLRTEFRKWRFQLVRDRVPDFARDESDQIQKIVDFLFNVNTHLEDFGSALWELRDSFTNKKRLFNWLQKEQLCTKLPPFLDTDLTRCVAIHCQQINPKNPFKPNSWTQPLASFDVIVKMEDSPMGRIFFKMLIGDNEYGENGKAFTLEGAVFEGNSKNNVTRIDSFPSPNVLFEYCDPLSNDYTRSVNVGEILMGITKHNGIFIVIALGDGEKDHPEYHRVGQIKSIPEKMSEKTNGSYNMFQILRVAI